MSPRRRILFSIAAFAAAALAMLGSIRWTIPEGTVRAPLEQALARDTGYRITALGAASFTALPWPVLQVSRLELARGGGSAETASVPLAKARLNLAGWLTGHPRISALTLFEPKINLVSAESMEETEAVATVVKNFLRQDSRPALTNLRVLAGEVTMDGGRWLSDLGIVVSNIAGNDLRLWATGGYRGQALRLEAVVSAGAGLSPRPVSWQLAIGDIRAGFQGALVSPPALDAEGRLTVALGAGALRSRPLSLSRETADILDGLSIDGTGRVSLPQLLLRDVVLRRGPHRLTGALDVTLSLSDPRLSATLHADELDLTAPLQPLADLWSAASWPDAPLSHAWLTTGNVDVRVSARRLTAGAITLEGAAFSARSGGGRLEAVLSDGRLGGGSVKGRVTLTAQDGRLELRGGFQGEGVDAAIAMKPDPAPSMLGIVNASAAFEASGLSLAEMVQGMSGRGQVRLRDGELAGLDVERLLRRSDLATAPAPGGRSRVNILDASWRMEGGVARLTESRLRGPLWQGGFDGAVDLPRRELDLLARFHLEGPEARRDERLLHIRGPLSAPVLAPLSSAPFRRS